MGSHPDNGAERRFLVAVYCPVVGGKVLVFKQLTPVSAQSLDVLEVGLAQSSL